MSMLAVAVSLKDSKCSFEVLIYWIFIALFDYEYVVGLLKCYSDHDLYV